MGDLDETMKATLEGKQRQDRDKNALMIDSTVAGSESKEANQITLITMDTGFAMVCKKE